LAAFFFFTYIAIRYIQQPLADIHSTRQTQTALSAFWILQEGWLLAYQTPVAGYPWSIPFEFPLYQTIVAVLAALSGAELDAVGRFVSYAFLVACAWPAYQLTRRLALPFNVFLVFCALLWTSPLNVYWGRTFMIETTALFFTFACLPYAIDLLRREHVWKAVPLFTLFAVAAVLQKSTTAGPALLFLLLAAVLLQWRKSGLSWCTVRQAAYPVVVFSIPLMIGLAWAFYADFLKEQNSFGSQLTSSALTYWNFGTLQQKFNPEIWKLVIWERAFGWSAGGVLGAIILMMPMLSGKVCNKYLKVTMMALALFLLPLLIFTNLHFVHEYYQVACVAFLLAALAVVIGGWMHEMTGVTFIVPVMTLIIMISNLNLFSHSYGIVVARTLHELAPSSVQAYEVGRYLRERTPIGTGLAVFGQGYSSEIAYQAQRISMTAPDWFSEYRQFWEQPQKYLGDVPLSAIVLCPTSQSFPTSEDIRKRMESEPGWKHEVVYGCELLVKST